MSKDFKSSKLFVLSSLLIGTTFFSFSQEKTFTEKLDGIQTSGKELTKSASTDNSSVGQSGNMSTSIPLVTVNSLSMQFPIQLNYAAGIRVDQKSGPVGLGWALPVGSIVRDYGAFEPDYTSTLHEGDMKQWDNSGNTGWLNPSGNEIDPAKHNQYLGYDALVSENLRQIPLSDFYHMSIPGMGSNTFWNGGVIGGSHNWKWTEFENWRIEHEEKLFQIDQEFSRINDANLDSPDLGGTGKDWFPFAQSYAAAIGVLPYVKEGFALKPLPSGSSFNPTGDYKIVEYEDFGKFTITDANGTKYVFGRALRGQKFVFQDDPYWSVLSNDDANSADGSFWKIDFIAEWLLTEILSADYEDSNGNGVADDEDAGDWIRFEYTEPTQTIKTIPVGSAASARLTSEVPTHREWSSFSQTDQASSLMRERAYLTKIVTPVQELDFTISQRFDVDHDYYSKPANKIGASDFWYEDRQHGEQGTSSDFDIIYPVETMKYDSIKIYSRLIDKNIYQGENLLAGAIAFNYADKGSPEELAVSDYLIRNNSNEDKLIDKPSSSTDFDIENYNDGLNKRGKTTLLSVDLFGGDLKDEEKTSYEFDYGYNPSYNEIHKRKIVRAYSYPSLRNSKASNDYAKSSARIKYSEQRLNSDGTSYSTILHEGTLDERLSPDDFLIDIPYQEIRYKLDIPDEYILLYILAGHTDNAGYAILSDPVEHKLYPVKDVYGFLYSENCIECPKAWSLTSITYPTGGQIEFEYEKGEFDPSLDQSNWSLSENSIPLSKEYNELAKQRSYVQDVYNRYASLVGEDGFGPNEDQYKTLTATFEVDMPSSYGIRLKRKKVNDRVNSQVDIVYEYGNGHFTSAPAEYVQSYVSAFNQFVLREKNRHSWEIGNYGPGPGAEFIYDYQNRMSHVAVTDLALDEYSATHFYENIDEIQSDMSYVRTLYGSIDGSNVIDYPSYNVFCYRLPSFYAWDGRYILARENLDQLPIMPIKTEFFDANQSVPYKTITNTYLRTKLTEYELAFDYTVGTSNPNEVKLWGDLNYYPIWLPITQGFISGVNLYDNSITISLPGSQTGEIGFGFVQTQIIAELKLPYNGIPVYEYNRWASFKTTLESTETNYKGVISYTNYEYDPNNFQLKKEEKFGNYITDKYITTYEYGYETYLLSQNNLFSSKNIINAPTRTNTYLNNVAPENALSASVITYDLNNYNTPRPLHSYSYETDVDPVLGTFTLVDFDYSSNNNANWRISQNDNLDYNFQSQLISSRTNRLFNKSVFGFNKGTVKAEYSYPEHPFDATYSGFEDFHDRNDILDWSNNSYKNESWFTDEIETVNEPAQSVHDHINNPCHNNLNPDICPELSREYNVVSIDNITGLNVGDIVNVKLQGTSCAKSLEAGIPDGLAYVWSVDTEITDIISLSDYTYQPTNVKSYYLCFSDPIEFPSSDCEVYVPNNGVISGCATNEIDERAHITIESTQVTKQNPTYHLNTAYSRTGKYSYQLKTKREDNVPFKKTAIRPVKIEYLPISNDCVDPVSPDPDAKATSSTSEECYWEYESSVWLKYDSDIKEIKPNPAASVKSADANGDALYQRGTVTETDNGSGVKIICDIWNNDRTILIDTKVFYAEDLNASWKQFTVNVPILKGSIKWLDVYVQNEISQVGTAVSQFKSVFVDDICIYPKGAKYNYQTIDKFGNTTFAVNNNDVYTESVYDQKGRAIAQKNAYGSTTMEAEYFENPNWTNEVNHVTERSWIDNGVYNDTRYYLDGFGKTKQVMKSDYERDARIVLETNYFNDRGFVSGSFKPYALKGANLINNFNGDYYAKTQNLYNSSHAVSAVTYEPKPERVISTVEPPRYNNEAPIINSQSEYASINPVSHPVYSFGPGELIVQEVTDAIGNKTKGYTDNLGRVVLKEQEIGNNYEQNTDGSITDLGTGFEISQTFYTYDKANRLTKIQDPEGKITTYIYNSLGVVVSKNSPDKGTSEMRYDRYGQVRFVRNAKDISAVTSNAYGTDQFKFVKYDEWGRVTESGLMVTCDVDPSTVSTPFTAQLFFDDYTYINDQNFPSSDAPLVQVHQEMIYDGTRDQFNSDALLTDIVYSEHKVVPSTYVYGATKTDQKDFKYMADGQLAQIDYQYDGLAGIHSFNPVYNDLRIAIGKDYVHPANSNYNFQWRNELDNFGRVSTSKSIHNSVETTNGTYYFDVLGNMLMKGIGSTGNQADPHIDYHVYKNDIRDQLVNHTSKNFRFGLTYNEIGNITNQYWSNEYFEPTTDNSGNPIPSTINQYAYYYDDMNRLIGADFREGSITGDVFDYYSSVSANLPNDFSCGVNEQIFVSLLEPIFQELKGNIKNRTKSDISRKSINALNTLKVEYQKGNTSYQYMSEQQKEDFLRTYISKASKGQESPLFYEEYMAEKNNDQVHREAVKGGGRVVPEQLKYVKQLIASIPFNQLQDCNPDPNATVYGYLPTYPFPTTVVNSNKYDAAYWYTENGNMTNLNRNDELGNRKAQDYTYSNPSSNQLSEVDWSDITDPNNPILEDNSQYTYDETGNLLTDPRNGVTDIRYISYNDMPQSITNGSGKKKYRYDGAPQRTVKELSEGDVEYYLDGVIVNQLGDVKSYQTAEGYAIPNNTGGIQYFYNIKDWLGTNRAVIDDNGNVLNAADHYPFGLRMPSRWLVGDSEGNRYQFTGHEFDSETAYGYHGARYYNRELGRYMNVDRFSEKFHDQSSYVYAGDNPVLNIDVNGDSLLFFDENGNYLGYSFDNRHKNAIVVIEKQWLNAFKTLYTDYNHETENDTELNAGYLLSYLGESYDIDAIKKFFTDHNGTYDSDQKISPENKELGVEWGNWLIKDEEGYITLSPQKSFTDNASESVTFINSPENPKARIHLHTDGMSNKLSDTDVNSIETRWFQYHFDVVIDSKSIIFNRSDLGFKPNPYSSDEKRGKMIRFEVPTINTFKSFVNDNE